MNNWLAQLDHRRDEMSDLVIRLANLNSYSHNPQGLAELAKVLMSEFATLRPDETNTTTLSPATAIASTGEHIEWPLGKMLSFAKRPAAPIQALLVIHYDTVYDPQNPFQRAKRLDDRTINGPGVADAKGGIVVLLNALAALEQSDVAKNLGWRVILNPDEEIGSPGSAPLLVQAAKSAHLALVFEPTPTPTTMVTQRKGSGNFSIIFRGRSAHAGREIEKGRNAVLAAAKFAVETTAAISAIPQASMNVGKIDGGGPVNVVPDLAILRFNLRVVTQDQQREVEQRLTKLLAAAHADGISAELSGQFSSPPWVMDQRGRDLFDHLLATAKELGLQVSATSSGGASDANKIAPTGIPVLDSLGPVGFDIHSPNERLDVDSLVQRSKLSALFLSKIAACQIALPPASMK